MNKYIGHTIHDSSHLDEKMTLIFIENSKNVIVDTSKIIRLYMACLTKNDEIVSQIKEMLRRKNKTNLSFNPKSAIVQASFSSRFFRNLFRPL